MSTKKLLPDLEAVITATGTPVALSGRRLQRTITSRSGHVSRSARTAIMVCSGYWHHQGTGHEFRYQHRTFLVVTQDWFESTFDTTNDECNEVVVKVTDGDTADVKTTIEKHEPGYQGQDGERDRQQVLLPPYSRRLAWLRPLSRPLAGFRCIRCCVSIFNIMMMSVNERIKEIGIMRSIGTQKKEVMSMFIFEAAIIGVVGSVIGGTAGLSVPGTR